jgi:hypothetical protein
MKLVITWILSSFGVIALSLILAWMDLRDRGYLQDDLITSCRPPGDQGEKLVATLYKSADGGPLTLNCTYHATIGMAP